MKKIRVTALIAALCCSLCLSACTGGTAGNEQSINDENDQTIKISETGETKSEEPAPEPSKTEEPASEPSKTEEPAPEPSKTEEPASEPEQSIPNDEKPAGDDAYLTKEFLYGGVFPKEIKDDIAANKDSVIKYLADKPDLYAYRSTQLYLEYYDNVVIGYLKPDIRKLQIDELVEYLKAHGDKEYYQANPVYVEHYEWSGEDREDRNIRKEQNKEIRERMEKFEEELRAWLYEHQAMPDAYVSEDMYQSRIYWCDANRIEDMREEIVIDYDYEKGPKITYSTYDDNGTCINREVVYYPCYNIYSY